MPRHAAPPGSRAGPARAAPVLLALVLGTASATVAGPGDAEAEASGPGPWPRIRKERVQTLLPRAMERTGVDAWLVICRENANDPLALHPGGENAGGTAVFLFLRTDEAVRSVAFSPAGEATALADVGLHDEVVTLERGQDTLALATERLMAARPTRIAVNSSAPPAADGLSSTQRRALEAALGPPLAPLLVSSEDLVVEWLSVKLPEAVEILRRAAALTERLEREAWASVVPGETGDSDVARFLKRRMRELEVEDAWAPDQNPNVNSGRDRGHSHATDRVIQPGDFVQTGHVFAFDGFHSWSIGGGDTKTISVEEMAVVTESGAAYLIPPQEELILISAPDE